MRKQTGRREFLKISGYSAAHLALSSSVSAQENEKKENEKKPNILWITTEDINPALGCYGDENANTPVLDQLAREGVLYENALATAPICAPARSCLITGVYATSLGTQHLRSVVEIPDDLKTLPHYLRQAGYFCTNYGKTDYNFDPQGVWDYWKSDFAPWRQRSGNQPFFSMINLGMTHEGRANFQERYEQAVEDLPEKFKHQPSEMELPPFYPDTPEIRRIWANQYDLISEMDRTVGEILQGLKDDGLYENTIIVFFSDHGFGLPRYKRWLNDSGLRVPLIIRVPESYQHVTPYKPEQRCEDLVSFVDFAPSMLNLAGVDVPNHMQGLPFLGKGNLPQRELAYGARSRADDMFEVSRSVQDERYIYIRQYMPHLPYIQRGEIFSDRKRSLKELRRLHQVGELPPEAEKLWREEKPLEELYDLWNDPHETENLADSPEHQILKERLKSKLQDWIVDHRDTGFLHESEMHIRAHQSTIYEMAQDPNQYDLKRILDAAEKVDTKNGDPEEFANMLQDGDSGVRYWAAVGLLALEEQANPAREALIQALNDESPCVQITAADVLCHLGEEEKALPVLDQRLRDDRVWVALHAARTVFFIGKKARPLKETIVHVLKKNEGEAAGGRYKDFNYAAFTSWSLEWALKNIQ